VKASWLRGEGRGPLLAVLAFVFLLWSILPVLVQTVPHADNVEQLNWSHALQWGYLKHPPLPTWILHGALELFAPGDYLGYALAMACVVASLVAVWRCARELLDPPAAWMALLLTTADYYLMGRGSFFNHNTVMLPFVAASAWAVLRIARGGTGWGPWLVLGLAQALGMLTKYQMAVVILANGVALLAAGCHRRPGFLRNAAIAGAATVLPLFPHALWLPAHGYSSFEYAGHSLLAGLGALARLQQAAGFTVQQLGRLAPGILALALVWGWWRFRKIPELPGPSPSVPPAPQGGAGNMDAGMRRALLVLAFLPLATILALTLSLGIAPQNHWGATTTLFLPLLAVAHLRDRTWLRAEALAPAVAGMHMLAAGWVVVAAFVQPAFHNLFPAAGLAREAELAWKARTEGEIRVVVGPDWEAGAIALHLPGFPYVVASGRHEQAPWVTPALVARCGALVLWRAGEPAEEQVAGDWLERTRGAGMIAAPDARGRETRIYMAVVMPMRQGECR
jgi:4-amino-4-deoxy-L-arabinose transferase-like glycosyltransferase